MSTFRGDKTGPNPTDRGKVGTKRHVLTDKKGIPLSVVITAANTHDMKAATEILPYINSTYLVLAMPSTCSPVIVPPQLITLVKTSFATMSTRFYDRTDTFGFKLVYIPR